MMIVQMMRPNAEMETLTYEQVRLTEMKETNNDEWVILIDALEIPTDVRVTMTDGKVIS